MSDAKKQARRAAERLELARALERRRAREEDPPATPPADLDASAVARILDRWHRENGR